VLRKIERYEVLDELGHGGMATVYRARDSKLDRLIALKVMHPHLRGAKEARDRFRREAQSVARLGHPRILEIYDYSGEESEESYIASQLLTGPTLKKWAEEHGPVPAEIAACIGIEIAEALAAAHEKGIVHRDVKPENILLHENRELKLTDFGIADMVDSQSMTATGQILGSPGHMAPEQVEGGDTDPRTDLFALGTVLYYLSTGRLPFVGKNPHQILKRIVDGEHPDPLRLEPRLGGTMRAILEKLLAKKPEGRYPSARALIDALRAFVLDLGIDDPGAEVARFLTAPAEETKSVYRRVVERYTALGMQAKEKGDIPRAHDCFSRVLAIDEGNQEVLELVAKIGRAKPDGGARRPLLWAAGLGAAVLLAVVVRLTGTGTHGVGDATTGTADAGAPDTLVASAASDAGPVLDAGSDAAAPVADAPSDVGLVIDEAIRRVAAPRVRRHVVFAFHPANGTVSVDGQPIEGWYANGADLTVGEHSVHFSPSAELTCCREETFTIDVPAGEGNHTVRHELPVLDAALVVRNPPGVSGLSVVVGDGRARGGSGVISVPIRSRAFRERLTVRATAPGFAEAETELDFTAGAETEWRPALERLPDPEPPPPPPP
jgi:serine/threonine-protein kinase